MSHKNRILTIVNIFLFFCILGFLAPTHLLAQEVAGQVTAKQGVINGSNVNVRQGASTTFPLLAQLQKGQQVIIKETKNDWHLVETSKGNGWVASWLVDVTGSTQTVSSNRSAVVIEAVVNVRQEPTTLAQRINQIKKGEKVQITGEKGDWFKIKTSSGQEGWVAGWLVSLETATAPQTTTPPQATTPPANANQEIVLVTANNVNIRQGPSINDATITQVNSGTELTVISKQGEWLKIKLPNGKEGWIAQWLTVKKDNKPLPTPTPHSNEMKLTLDNNKVLTLNNQGDKLQITISGIEDNQYQIGRISDQLIIELLSTNLKSTVLPIDNWGVKEARVVGRAVIIAFNKNFTYEEKYHLASKSLNIEIQYPTEQLIPVKQIKLNPTENQTVLQIASGRKIAYTTYEQSSGKLIIDLPQSLLQLASKEEAEQNSSLGPIRKVSSRQLSPDIVRIEAEFAPGAQYQVTQNGDNIVIGASLNSNRGALSGKTIVIDPGHGTIQPGGWTDPGTTGRTTGTAERDINLAISLKLRDMLTQQGARVVMTHDTGRTHLSLAGRAAVANDINADIFVSVHANANTNRAIQGTQTFYYAPTWHSELSSQRWLRQRLALSIQTELVKAGGRSNRGITEESFAVLRETNMPSVLVETAFMSNHEEDLLLGTDAFRTKMAQGIFKGIESYFQSL